MLLVIHSGYWYTCVFVFIYFTNIGIVEKSKDIYTTLCKRNSNFSLKPSQKVPYTCSKISIFFWGKFFRDFIFGHFFCPFLKKDIYFVQNSFLDHN
jgi:hypothetical protein